MVDKIIKDVEFLHQGSRETSIDEIRSLGLCKRIKAAVGSAWTPGCGLAAIQIGEPVRYAWYVYKGKEYELINPVILKTWGTETIKEGCLSIPGKWPLVTRAVTIQYTSNGKMKKKAWGVQARIIQHEIDHMNGILNTDSLRGEVSDG